MTKTKQIVIQALFASALGSAVTTTSSSPAYTADTYGVDLGCAQCIRSGFKYLVPDTSGDSGIFSKSLRGLIKTNDSDGGECCNGSDNTDCTALDGSDVLTAGFVRVNPASVDIDQAIHSCPTQQKFCGDLKEIEFNGPSDSDVELQMTGDWTKADQCTWLIKSNCGAPGLKIENVDTTSSDIDIYYMEYNTAEVELEASGKTNWPKYVKTDTTQQTCGVPDYTQDNTLDYQGEMPYFKQVTRVAEGGLTETFRMVPGKIIAEWMTSYSEQVDDYNLAVAAYDILRAEYNTYVQEWNAKYVELEDTFGLQTVVSWYFGSGLHAIQQKLKPPVPQVPPAYDGPTMYTTGTTLNFLQREESWGLGLLTADVIPVGLNQGKIFGVLGSGQNMALGAKFTQEVSESCSPSYQVLTVIPKIDCGASCAKVVKAQASSNEWGFNLNPPTTPSAADSILSKMALPTEMTQYMWGYYGDAY